MLDALPIPAALPMSVALAMGTACLLPLLP